MKSEYLHEGISARSFECQFSLASHVEVRGASYEDGMARYSVTFRTMR